MSMMISSLCILFLCFSMHTCNARHLAGAIDDKLAAASHKKLPSSTKVLEMVELLKGEDSISVKKGAGREYGTVFHMSHHETSKVVKLKDSEASLDEMRQNRAMSSVAVPIKRRLVPVSGRVVARKNYDERRMEHAGTENLKPSTNVGLLRSTSIEGSRRRELSSSDIEHGYSYGKEGRDMKVKEEPSLMDYDPPHQKPPIHNGET